jgi:hypothetical protein
MPLISWLLDPQLRSLCHCRSAARLPQGGSSFFKPAMLPAQMTLRTSRYTYCQKMASASSKKDLCNLSRSSFATAHLFVGRASTPFFKPIGSGPVQHSSGPILITRRKSGSCLKFELNLRAPLSTR